MSRRIESRLDSTGRSGRVSRCIVGDSACTRSRGKHLKFEKERLIVVGACANPIQMIEIRILLIG